MSEFGTVLLGTLSKSSVFLLAMTMMLLLLSLLLLLAVPWSPTKS